MLKIELTAAWSAITNGNRIQDVFGREGAHLWRNGKSINMVMQAGKPCFVIACSAVLP
jgi:hypothetical protein